MSKYNLVHIIPRPQMHGLNGYKEVIESVQWGLEQLGHNVAYSLNSFDGSATNIIFGAQVLPIDALNDLPDDTIIYNFEQLRGLEKDEIRPEVHFIAKNFQVWDYSSSNSDAWRMLEAKNQKLVPVGYAPILTRIPKPNIQDIDVLIYGLSGDERLEAFHRISLSGLKIVFLSGLYGEARDELIARSKLVLNVNLYKFANIFEIVRVSYLLSNKKAVIATINENTVIEKEFAEAIKPTTLDSLVDDCIQLLNSDSERAQLEKTGYEAFVKSDIREIIKVALS